MEIQLIYKRETGHSDETFVYLDYYPDEKRYRVRVLTSFRVDAFRWEEKKQTYELDEFLRENKDTMIAERLQAVLATMEA